MHKLFHTGWMAVAALAMMALATPASADLVKVGASGQRYQWSPGTC